MPVIPSYLHLSLSSLPPDQGRLHPMPRASDADPAKPGGSRPELPAKGRELRERKRRLERYGVRQEQRGSMDLGAAGEYFRLTWKGANLGAWRSIWPISLLRNLWVQGQSQTRFRSLGVAQVRSTSSKIF